MALIVHKRTINNSLLLKTTAFVIGYSIWAALSSTQTIHVAQEIPLAFYNVPDSWHLQAPDTVTVNLVAKRAHLRKLSTEKLTVHLDAATLKPGENRINLHDASLFLSKHIAVDYDSPLIVHVSSQAL